MFIRKSIVELCATICNMSSNIVMLSKMYNDPNQKVPPIVILLQVIANILWFSFAVLQTDAYLGTTTFSSLSMQLLTLYLVVQKKRETKKNIPTSTHSTSREKLLTIET